MKLVTSIFALVTSTVAAVVMMLPSPTTSTVASARNDIRGAVGSVHALGSLNVNSNTLSQGDEHTSAGAISIWLATESAADVRASIVLTDPTGRRVGEDVRSKTTYSEIPGSGSERNALAERDPLHFELSTRADYGDYRIDIIPAARETCTLVVVGSFSNRQPDELRVEHIQLRNQIVRYRLIYTAHGTGIVRLEDER